jgi:hypothetical protein
MRSLLLLVAFVALVAVVMAQDADKTQGKTQQRKARSVLQACRKQLPTLCANRKDTMKCLEDGLESITDEVCKSWVQARKTCLAAATSSSKCAKKENPRSCLRSLKAEDLGSECTETDFYKSVRMFGAIRRGKGKSSGQPAKAV